MLSAFLESASRRNSVPWNRQCTHSEHRDSKDQRKEYESATAYLGLGAGGKDYRLARECAHGEIVVRRNSWSFVKLTIQMTKCLSNTILRKILFMIQRNWVLSRTKPDGERSSSNCGEDFKFNKFISFMTKQNLHTACIEGTILRGEKFTRRLHSFGKARSCWNLTAFSTLYSIQALPREVWWRKISWESVCFP